METLMRRSATLQGPTVNQMREDFTDIHEMITMTKIAAGRGLTLEDSSTECQDAWMLGEEAKTAIRKEAAAEAGIGENLLGFAPEW
jgi:hypothetical protein